MQYAGVYLVLAEEPTRTRLKREHHTGRPAFTPARLDLDVSRGWLGAGLDLLLSLCLLPERLRAAAYKWSWLILFSWASWEMIGQEV